MEVGEMLCLFLLIVFAFFYHQVDDRFSHSLQVTLVYQIYANNIKYSPAHHTSKEDYIMVDLLILD